LIPKKDSALIEKKQKSEILITKANDLKHVFLVHGDATTIKQDDHIVKSTKWCMSIDNYLTDENTRQRKTLPVLLAFKN